jgi:putative FmdB family regulatory protein
MPLYEYRCPHCEHEFVELQPMSRCSEPTACLECGDVAQRIISAPRLNTMRADVRSAHQTNERSAHQPRSAQKHQCGAGCSHGHSNSSAAQPLKQASGVKRPWMLGH